MYGDAVRRSTPLMAMPSPPRDPGTTVEKLVEAALRCFGEAGYERATVDRICSEAGYSKGAFYANFKSKEELFLHILERRLERNQARVLALCQLDGPARDWLLQLLDTLLDFAPENQHVRALSLEFMAQGMRHEEIGARLTNLHQTWRDLFAAHLRASPEYHEGRMRGTPEAIAYAIVAMIDGFIFQVGLDPDPTAKEATLERIRPLVDAWFEDAS